MSNTDLFLIQLNSFLLRVEQNTGFEIERGRYSVVFLSPPPSGFSSLLWNYKGFQLNKYKLINVHLSLHGRKKWSATLDLRAVPF